MMKKINIIYKLLLLLPLISLISCDNNDDMVDVITQTTTTTENAVFIETDDAAETTTTYLVVGDSDVVTVGLNNALTTDIDVVFNVTRDGSAAILDTDYTLNDATVLAEETNGTSTIEFLTDGLYEVSIASSTGIVLVDVANKELFQVDKILITAVWDDAYYDYDLYLLNGSPDNWTEVISDAGGATNYEALDISISSDVLVEGEYTLFMDDYWSDNASIDVDVTIQTSKTTEEILIVTMDQSKYAIQLLVSVDENGVKTIVPTLL
jgi:hypothetical protein